MKGHQSETGDEIKPGSLVVAHDGSTSLNSESEGSSLEAFTEVISGPEGRLYIHIVTACMSANASQNSLGANI